jgi:predicted metalloendopeptidase
MTRRFAALLLLAACSGPASDDAARVELGDGPANDFYTWVNADWMATNPVPEEYGSWGAFHEINARNEVILREVLEQAAAQADLAGDSVEDRLGVFWQSGMDVETLERLGAQPLEAELAAIDAIVDRAELPVHFARLALLGVPVVFGVQGEADLDDAGNVVLWAMQAGWGLPEKGYYTRTDDQTERLRIQYGMHIAKLMTLLGDAPSAAVDAADAVLALERELAAAGMSAEDLRQPENYRNKLSWDDARRLTPAFDWQAYFDALGVPAPAEMNLPGPDYFEAFDRLYSDRPLAQWKALLRYHLARRAAPYLSDEFASVEWEFYGKALQGTQAMKPRWKRVLDAAEAAMGEGVGRLFVARAFPPQAKATADRMVDDLFAAYRASLADLDWMSEETRAQAVAKLDAMARKIGHPATWEDYPDLEFSPSAYLRNAWTASRWHLLQSLAEVGGPVDADSWEMNPHEVNAYYNPLANEIVFPAGILQPPFFSGDLDAAQNYGAMGAIIGHEITHGFDDTGSRFDAEGNLRNWWTDEDRTAFDARAAVLVAQFDACQAMEGLPVNGTLTLGENIADLGGVKMAYRAFLRTAPGDAPEADGLTPHQRFFMAWARAWRWNVRPERLKFLVQTDAHAPNPFRANLPLGNLQVYADAFGLDANAPMVRPASERASIW